MTSKHLCGLLFLATCIDDGNTSGHGRTEGSVELGIYWLGNLIMTVLEKSRVNLGRALKAVAALLCCSTTPLLAAGPVDPLDPPRGRFSDEWVEIHLGGAKVGFGHMSLTREGDRIRTQSNYLMKMGRADQSVEVAMEQHTVETVDGRPLSFGFEMAASVMKTVTRGTISDGRVAIISEQFGMEQKQEFDFPKGALMTWGLYRETLMRGFEPGTEYTLSTYAPELRLDGPIDAVTRIGGFEEFDLNSERVMLQRVTVTMESPLGSMEMVSWIDKTGRIMRAKVPAPGMGDMVMIASDQARAMADFVPPEIFMTTALKAGRKIDRAHVKRIVYRLKPKNDDVDPELENLPTTDMQRIIPKGKGVVEVVVTRQLLVDGEQGSGTSGSVLPKPKRVELAKLDCDDLAEYIDANLMINTDDPRLKELAVRAAAFGRPSDHADKRNHARKDEGSEASVDQNRDRQGAGETEINPYELADRLRRFVTDYVEHKNLNIGFATASEVARTREGDCSEHAVLLAALGRINGLPSRVAVGIAYVPLFGNEDDIFGYHMWTQFYIDGQWIDVDAALRETQVSPARIAFAVSSLKHAGLADLSLPLLTKIGAIDLEIVSVE
jgi:hypothetical protein